MSVRVGYFGAHRNRLGESPVWDGDVQCLWWIDARAVAATEGCIHCAREDGTTVATWRYPRAVGSIALADEGLVAAMADGFYRIAADGAATMLHATGTRGGGLRFNDGKTDRNGSFLGGQLEVVEHSTPAAGLWRLGRDGTAIVLADGLRLANATCFSPAGDILYFADSTERVIRVHRYDPERTTLGPRIATFDCRRFGTIPDGATVDRAGNVWVAMVLDQAIVCLSPGGDLLRRIDLPIPFPSCPAFGGRDLATLFVTTIAGSGRHLKHDHEDAGRILAIDGLDTRGIAEARWAPID